TSRGGVTETRCRPRWAERADLADAGPASIPPRASANRTNAPTIRTAFISTSPCRSERSVSQTGPIRAEAVREGRGVRAPAHGHVGQDLTDARRELEAHAAE